MIAITKNIFLIVIFVCFGISAEAQEKKREFSATTGFLFSHSELGSSFQEFDPGGHLGFNLYSKKVKRFKSDLQLSINISGRRFQGSYLSVNALYGGRYYLSDPVQPRSVFVNALIGGAYVSETGDDWYSNFWSVGYSAGCFAKIDRFILGISAESYNNFILKGGYTF